VPSLLLALLVGSDALEVNVPVVGENARLPSTAVSILKASLSSVAEMDLAVHLAMVSPALPSLNAKIPIL